MRKIFILSLLAMCAAGNAFAQNAPRQGFEFGTEVYFVEYEEPNFMKNEGVMYGLSGAYTCRPAGDWMLRGEARGAFGEVDYTSVSTGSDDAIEDYTFEGRILGGYDFHLSEWVLTPYFGAGYRYLNDDSSGRVTTTGHRGYERESNYFYSPAGVELGRNLGNGWSIGMNVEYDIFWTGEQKSHLSDAVPSFGDIDNDQDGGYGARASIRIVKETPSYDFVIEPFVRWWDIDESERSNLTFAGVIVGYGLEPRNETVEAGVKLALLF